VCVYKERTKDKTNNPNQKQLQQGELCIAASYSMYNNNNNNNTAKNIKPNLLGQLITHSGINTPERERLCV